MHVACHEEVMTSHGVQEDPEFNQFMDWIIEENAQSRLKEPEVEENTEAELIESDVAVQELDVEHIELMNWVSIGFPGMAPDVEPIELIDWEVEEENTQVRLITAEEGLQEVQVRPLQTPELVKKEQEEFPSSSSSPSSLNIEGSSAGHVVVVTTVDEVKSPQAPTGVDASPKHVALLTAGGNTMMLHHWQK
ncbi:unnamed protein product [Sphagnum troendelagicum]